MSNLILSFITVFSLSAWGAYEFVGTPQTITQSGYQINVYPEVKVKTDKIESQLKLTGQGLRIKTVLGAFKVNVYYAASYAEGGAEALGNNPIEAFKKAKAKVMHLFFLRNVSAEELRTSFEESLDKNGVNLEDPAIINLFDQFNIDVKAGETGTMVATLDNNNSIEKVSVVLSRDLGGEGFELGTNIWRVWFGIPIDAEMAKLQKQLLGKAN